MKTKPTGYWTFYCNPSKWEIDEFLLSGEKYDNYLVTPWQATWFKPGQFGVVRVGVDTRSKDQLDSKKRLQSGIYAIVQVISVARKPTESDYEDESDLYWLGNSVGPGRKVVDLKYVMNLLDQPLLIKDIKKLQSFADNYLINGFQASTMPLSKEVFNAIVNRVGEPEDAFRNIEENIVKSPKQLRKLESENFDAPPQIREVISKHIERGPLAQHAKRLNQYKCMICEYLGRNPVGFRKRNGDPYIEVHHVVPVARLQLGSLNLPNLMTLCANHHRECHYGVVEFLPSNNDKFVVKIEGQVLEIQKLKL